MKKKYTITIIEPSVIIRNGLRFILEKIQTITKIEVFNNWNDFITSDTDHYDLILLNPLACCRGAKLKNQVTERFKSTTLIGIITTVFERDLHQNYSDVIYLSDTENEIQKVIMRHLSDKGEHLPVHQLLSEREIEVLTQFAKGLSTKEIADHLNISTHTVISHRKNISSKLGIKSSSAMAIYAVTSQLINATEVLHSIPKKGD